MPAEPTEMLAQYFAAVSAQDAWIGELVDAIEAGGALDDTLVIVTSDHGHMNGHHGLVGKANATLPQNLFEESVRVPLVLRWPARLPRGFIAEIFADHLDLFATVLDAAGIELDEATEQRLSSPGRSLLHRFDGSPFEWRGHRFSEHGNVRMVADHRFKLVRRYPPIDPRFGDELYDLENDPRETSNLIDDPGYQDRRVKLETELDEHFARFEDPDRSGMRIMEQPPCNGREPWTRLAAELSRLE
jgi:arylsulfatase A-like enzyme